VHRAHSDALGELLGQLYVASLIPGQLESRTRPGWSTPWSGDDDDIAGLDWMADATKQIAIAKLGKIVRMIGYPERWKTYDYDVVRDDFAGNALRAAAFEFHRELARAGTPVDRSGLADERLPGRRVLQRQRQQHRAGRPGILQPPFFGQDARWRPTSAAFGMDRPRAHPRFDDRGAQFDGAGNLVNWWQQDDPREVRRQGAWRRRPVLDVRGAAQEYIQASSRSARTSPTGRVKMAFSAYRALRQGRGQDLHRPDGFSEASSSSSRSARRGAAVERPAETDAGSPSIRTRRRSSGSTARCATSPSSPTRSLRGRHADVRPGRPARCGSSANWRARAVAGPQVA